MKTSWILPFVLLAGCLGCGSYDALPRQNEATTIVWALTYEKLDGDPPSVQWITQKDLNCGPDHLGVNHAFFRGRWYGDVGHGDHCVGGVTWPDWHLSQVALADGDTFSTSPFAHELFHQYLSDIGGDGDPGHTNPGFGLGFGHTYGIVDAAVDMLKENGL